jgi:ABC-type branched-subunit amino acid transport system substrate-binding protein
MIYVLFLRQSRMAVLLAAVVSLAACSSLWRDRRPEQPLDRFGARIEAPAAPAVDDSEATAAGSPGETAVASEAAGLRGAPPPSAVPAGVTRAALLLPLSGRLATLGQAMLKASEMAVFDLADASLQVVPYDTKGTFDGAAAAAKLALLERASLVLGPVLASSVRAVTPMAVGHRVPVVSFSSDSRVAGDGIQIMGFTPEAEVAHILDYAANQGLSRFAVLAPNDAYGAAVAAAARSAARARGGSVVVVQLYDAKTEDFGPVVEKLRAGGKLPSPPPAGAGGSAPPFGPGEPPAFDSLLIADGGSRLRRIAARLAEQDLGPPAVRLLGTGAWDEAELAGEPALIGAWFAAPAPSFRADFEKRYAAAFGTAPPRLATLAYDATAIAALIARERAGGAAADTVDLIRDPAGFLGRDGLFRFPQSGVAERKLAVLQIERDGPRVVGPPAVSFTGS